jgi:hypothetical protein
MRLVDFVMKPSIKRQIRNGLRVGGGIGAFWIAAMLIGVSMEGLQSVAPGHVRLWPDVAVAGGLIVLAAGIMMLTARIWVLYLAGCLLVAIPKCLIVITSGRDFYSPHDPFSRLEAAEIALFSIGSLLLMYRILANHVPTMLDRMAFTLYVVSFAFELSGHFSIAAPWQIVALAALFVAWWFSRKKHKRHPARGISTAE